MGSSPVTATTRPHTAEDPGRVLFSFLRRIVGWQTGEPIVVAFSGGPDSTALLAATVAGVDTPGRVYAAHYDHQLDPDSERRALAAQEIAADLGATWVSERATDQGGMQSGVEDWARRQRYAFLERIRQKTDAVAILTAHHLEDQVETVLLRMLMGSGLRGLAGTRPWICNVGRPWLGVPRAQSRSILADSGLEPVLDPTNQDLSRPRNLVRHCVVPRLRAQDRDIDRRLAHLARLACRLDADCADLLRSHLEAGRSSSGIVTINADRLQMLPGILWPFALALLDPASVPLGRSSLPTRGEMAELKRQLRSGRGIGVSLHGGDRWIARQGRLERKPLVQSPATESWCLDLALPGAVDLPAGGRMQVLATPTPEPWMLTGDPLRTGIELDPGVGLRVRTRRPGDRIRPLGCNYERKLKDVLIDARVPAAQRDRLPLLLADERPVWVPGVTIDDRCRIQGKSRLWVAQWYPSRRN